MPRGWRCVCVSRHRHRSRADGRRYIAARFVYRHQHSSGNAGDFVSRHGGGPAIVTNSLGFRDREIPPKSPTDTVSPSSATRFPGDRALKRANGFQMSWVAFLVRATRSSTSASRAPRSRRAAQAGAADLAGFHPASALRQRLRDAADGASVAVSVVAPRCIAVFESRRSSTTC